jgi:hypothetical protein
MISQIIKEIWIGSHCNCSICNDDDGWLCWWYSLWIAK